MTDLIDKARELLAGTDKTIAALANGYIEARARAEAAEAERDRLRAVLCDPTPEMIRAGMDRIGWWVEAHPPEFDGSYIIQDEISEDDAKELNDQLSAELREVFAAMIEAAPMKEPDHGDT